MKRAASIILTLALVFAALTVPAFAAENSLIGNWVGTFSGKALGSTMTGTAGVVVTETTAMLSVKNPLFDVTIGGAYTVSDGKITFVIPTGDSFSLNYKLVDDKLTLTGALSYNGISIEDVVVELARKAPAPSAATAKIVLPETGLYEDGAVYEALKGSSIQFKAEVSEDLKDGKLSWKSSKSKLANITGKGGLMKCKKPGETTITLQAKQGKVSATDSVTIRVVELKLNKTKANLFIAGNTKKKPGEIQLTAEIKPATASAAASTVLWTVSDPEILTVDETGLVKPLKVGKASVTVSNQYGQQATCQIIVK